MHYFASMLFLLTFIFSLQSNTVRAQNWNEINPDGTEILVDTNLVRSVIITLEPGEVIGPVTHPAHFAYILTDGQLRVYFEGKEPVTMHLEEGMSIYNEPQSPHRTENIGEEPVRFMLVELKEHPYKQTLEKY